MRICTSRQLLHQTNSVTWRIRYTNHTECWATYINIVSKKKNIHGDSNYKQANHFIQKKYNPWRLNNKPNINFKTRHIVVLSIITGRKDHKPNLVFYPSFDAPSIYLVSTFQSLVMAWRVAWAIGPAGGACTWQLLQVPVFDKLHDRWLVAGGGLAGPFLTFQPPRRSRRRQQHQHYCHHQWQNEPALHGHLRTMLPLQSLPARRSQN